MSHPVVLFGATSILGFTLAKLFSTAIVPFTSPGNTAPAVQHWPALNLENHEWVEAILDQHQPEILLYCHAVCDVPKCEADPDWAYEVNVGHLQRTLKVLPQKIRLIYISSDHVFGGDGTYNEDSLLCPVSVYGRTRVEAEQCVLKRPQSLVIRTGLAIGLSPTGRTGHLDWLRYRKRHNLPITIVDDEYRSVVLAEDLARRVMDLVRSQKTGIRHIASRKAISRIELAEYLLKRLGLETAFHTESRSQRQVPHLGRVELSSKYRDEWATPLPFVMDNHNISLLGEVV